jgi:hypothetical protein
MFAAMRHAAAYISAAVGLGARLAHRMQQELTPQACVGILVIILCVRDALTLCVSKSSSPEEPETVCIGPDKPQEMLAQAAKEQHNYS